MRLGREQERRRQDRWGRSGFLAETRSQGRGSGRVRSGEDSRRVIEGRDGGPERDRERKGHACPSQ